MLNTLKSQVMKRLLTIGLILTSVFALTNCSEQIVSPDQDDIIVDETIENDELQEEGFGVPYEIFVDEPSTKTISDGQSTYWVNEEVALENGLSTDDIDRVSLFSISTEPSESTYKNHGKFTYVGDRRFVGERGTIGKTNHWYCVYPYNSSHSTNAPTEPASIKARVEIGSANLTLERADNKMHIAGKNYPMFGTITNATHDATLKFTQMSHMSSLVALKVVNQGDSPKDNLTKNRDGKEQNIVIREVTFSVPSVTTKDADGNDIKQTSIPIVGLFDATIPGSLKSASFTAVSGTSNTVTITLPNEITIAPGEDATFYFAIRPFGLNNVTRINTGLILDVGINGSVRRVTIPDNAAQFAPGSMKTIRVPVKFSYPKVSDATEIKSSGRMQGDQAETAISLGVSPKEMNINGENTPVYVLSKNGASSKVVISGFAKDLIAALPVGFYTSRWNNLPAAMKVHSVQLWLPKYKDGYKTVTERVAIKDYSDSWALKALLVLAQAAGIKFDDTYGIPRSTMDVFVNNQSLLNFNAIVDSYDFDKNNVIIMDESPIYKEVKSDRIDNFLDSFQATVKEEDPATNKEVENKYVATCDGLSALLTPGHNEDGSINFPDSDTQKLAESTAKAIYYKFHNTFSSFTSYDLDLSGLLGYYFSGWEDFMHKIRDAKFQVILETCPYDFSDSGTINPLVIWGFDAYGPNDETKPNN